MEGFFTKKETQSESRPNGKRLSCVSCGLPAGCKSPKMKPSGNFKKGILNIMSHPTKLDDRKGRNYIDKRAEFLKNEYIKLGIDLEEDCMNTYSVNCYTKDVLDDFQIECCRRSLLKLIRKNKPKVIVLFGDEALKSIIGHQWKKDLGKIERWRGFTIPDQIFGCWIVPLVSPSLVLEPKLDVETLIWRKELEKVKESMGKSFPVFVPPKITYINDLKELNNIKGEAAHDYETNSLKSYTKKSKILCAAVATKDKVIAFKIPEEKKQLKYLKRYLQNPEVKKIAHNMKFEESWTVNKLGIETINWFWDTMLGAHIINNREKIVSLKFQGYVNFGVAGYDEEIEPYLKGVDPDDSNSLNRLKEFVSKPKGWKKLMKYCAWDAYLTILLKAIQEPLINRKQTIGSPYGSNIVDAYNLLHEGSLAFGEAERQGFRTDKNYAEKAAKEIESKMGSLEKVFKATKFYKNWKKSSNEKINLQSPDQLRNYLYDVLKLTPPKTTKSGLGSTDEDSLALLNIPALNLLLRRKKLEKLKSTYLLNFMRQERKGFIHPFFNLAYVKTYRSSSKDPNFQNLPSRDKEAMKIIKGALFPRKGNLLAEYDYGAIEVAIAACYHKDPTMLEYLNKGFDFHGDIAKQIFLIKSKEWDIDKNPGQDFLRKATKNCFVFPQFYGDYWKKNAENYCNNWLHLPINRQWKKSDGVKYDENLTIGAYLINKGIKNFNTFAGLIKKIEDDFWNNRFPVYRDWKKLHFGLYQKYGNFASKTGFVFQNNMTFNQAVNYPVQGAAFHCLLWSFIQLTKELKKEGMKSRLIGQIHDAFLLDIYPPELEKVHKMIMDIGTKKLPKAFKWINVPLKIDSEIAPIDKSWAEKKKFEPSF